jgi:hypothetical protein
MVLLYDGIELLQNSLCNALHDLESSLDLQIMYESRDEVLVDIAQHLECFVCGSEPHLQPSHALFDALVLAFVYCVDLFLLDAFNRGGLLFSGLDFFLDALFDAYRAGFE